MAREASSLSDTHAFVSLLVVLPFQWEISIHQKPIHCPSALTLFAFRESITSTDRLYHRYQVSH
jgi:hypothetical protein